MLTEQQVLEFGRQARNAGRMRGMLALIPVLVLIVAPLLTEFEAFDRIGLPWQIAAMLVLFIPLLLSMFREHRRTVALLDGCDYREVPKAEGVAARWAQKLEYDRSISQGGDDTSSGRLMIGVGVLVIGTLVMVFANSPYTVTVRAALAEMLSLDPETINMIGLIVTLPAIIVLIYFVSRGTGKNLKKVPLEARPTDDGNFLYRFRGRDYVLTREQALRHRPGFWDSSAAWLVVVMVFILLLPEIAADPPLIVTIGFFASFLASVLGGYWFTAARLKGCDYRDVPEAKGMMARCVQWLEFYRSIYLRDNPSPIELIVICGAAVGVFLLFVWLSEFLLLDVSGLEYATNVMVLAAAIALCLVHFAVPFYAFCRTIAGNRTGTSGSDKPPNS